MANVKHPRPPHPVVSARRARQDPGRIIKTYLQDIYYKLETYSQDIFEQTYSEDIYGNKDIFGRHIFEITKT